MKPDDLYEIARQSVCMVSCSISNKQFAGGTAFVYKSVLCENDKKTILYFFTNAHVIGTILNAYDILIHNPELINSPIELTVHFGDRDYHIINAYTHKNALTPKAEKDFNFEYDFAIFPIELDSICDVDFFPISSAALRSIKAGQNVFATGYPLGLNLTISNGIIGNADNPKIIQHNILINPGNSGGPTLDENGNIIGICVAGLLNAQGINYSINMRHILDFIKDPKQMECVNIPNLIGKIKKDTSYYSQTRL